MGRNILLKNKQTTKMSFFTSLTTFYDNGFKSQFVDDEYDTNYPNRRVKTARKPRTTQTRASQKTANKYCYEPKENLKRSAYVPNENQENIDPRFSQNEPKQTPKFYKSSFQSNTVNNNGNKTTITKKHYRDNDNSDTISLRSKRTEMVTEMLEKSAQKTTVLK